MRILKDWIFALKLLWASLKNLQFLPQQLRRSIEQCLIMGYQTLPIVGLLSLFLGGILALQTGYSLDKLPGAQHFLGSIVGLSMCRELGPLMTAFLLTGRVGSAITAELGSKAVYQEIDALKTMNLDPVRLLVMPRVVGALVMMPFLVMFSNVLGWIGGWIVTANVDFISIDGAIYWRSLKQYVDIESINDGLVKAEIFALTIILISSAIGLKTRGGPREIGTSVTSTLVQSMVAILTLDYIITKILL